MSIISYEFIFFISMIYFLYYTFFKNIQWVLLLISSLIFCFNINIYILVFILILSIFNFIFSNNIFFSKDKCYRKKILYFSIFFNILFLIFSKNFYLISNIFNFNNIVLNFGVSFYTLKNISYLIDIYNKKYEVEKSFFKYLLYIIYFPELIQGPINRYDYVQKSMYNNHEFSFENLAYGFERILLGTFKKLVIADRIAPAVNIILENGDKSVGAYILILIVFYTFQLYADFTGGIDIVIGISNLFGLKSIENFNRPYSSKSLQEFWTRWHMSLGKWFKEYVFYPISVHSFFRNLSKYLKKNFKIKDSNRLIIYLDIFIVWILTGFWHGIKLNYILWGILNAIIIIISLELKKYKIVFPNNKYIDFFRVIRTFLIVSSLRIFDLYENVILAFKKFISIFTDFKIDELYNILMYNLNLNLSDYIILVLSFIGIISINYFSNNMPVIEKLNSINYKYRHFFYIFIFLSIILFGKYSSNYVIIDFIYKRY